MKNKNNKKWATSLIIIILLAILILLIVFSGSNRENTKLTLSERNWIENNNTNMINVSVVNTVPVFSYDGEGVFFDYLDYLKEQTKLSFNLIPYQAEGDVLENDIYFEIVKSDKFNELNEDSLVFYKDYYVLIGKEEDKIDEPNEIINKKIGVLNSDLSSVSNYLLTDSTVNYTSFNNITELKEALDKDSVNYIAVPKNRYYAYVLENNYHINYNITELKEAYTINTSKDAPRALKSIVRKNYINYKNSVLQEHYNSNLIDFVLNAKSVSDKSKADFLSKKYTFGYIENAPYTGYINNRLIGLDSTYLNNFSDISNSSFKFKKYKSVKDLTKALNEGKVDFAPSYYNYSGLSGKFNKTISPYNEEYYVLVEKSNTNLVVNSVKSLKDIKVISLNNTLGNYIKKTAGADVKFYDRVSTLLNATGKDSVIVLDRNTYEMYKKDELANYRILFSDKTNLGYGFIITDSSTNETFNVLLSSYLEFINNKQLYNTAWKSYTLESKEVSHAFIYIIVGVVILFVLWLVFKNKIKAKKKTKREETIRYIDPLTSLKNRNYLNKNFKKWESNAIYPQSIIMINLNNLRHVNDVYGHEEGDRVIRLAANILIKNQLEQSDIIRSDGNEYLIYMVGYEESKVVSYMRKLYKELNDLPYGFGASLGYSMIEDDIKTIDDAINEAVLEIRTNREMKNKK